MRATIFYFSGTGNSLHVAAELQKRIADSELVPVVRQVRKGDYSANSAMVGFVFPMYYFTLPEIMEDFIRVLDLSEADYIFAVVTRGGSAGYVFDDLRELLAEKGKRLSANFYITMGNNFILHYNPPSEKEIDNLLEKEEKSIEHIASIVDKKKVCTEYKHGSYLLEKVFYPIAHKFSEMTGHFGLAHHFYTDVKCDLCGLCAHVCLADRVKIHKCKPEWDNSKKCYNCFACIQFCPMNAVQIKMSGTVKRGRYHHPYVLPEQIEKEKKI